MGPVSLCFRVVSVWEVVLHCGGRDVFLQFNVMRSKLEVIERMFRVSCGVLVVDAQLAEWLNQILSQ